MKTVPERPKLDDFDYKFHTEYNTYCADYDHFCEIEQKLKKMERGSEEYEKLLKEAFQAYLSLLQEYHFVVADASVAVADAKNRLTELGCIWRHVPAEPQTEKSDGDKLLQEHAVHRVKKQLQAAVLDVCILEDKAHLYLYDGEELVQTRERLLRRFFSVSADLAALARDKYLAEDRYLKEIISTYCRAWCWIDVALRGEFADEVFAAHEWIKLNTDSNASELREIIRKTRYGEQTGDEE